MSVGEGGAPAVKRRTLRESLPAAGFAINMVQTVGAAQKCVTPSRNSCHTRSGSMRGMQTLQEPAAAVAHGKHQPLQWNIGSVQRYWLSAVRRWSSAIASAFR